MVGFRLKSWIVKGAVLLVLVTLSCTPDNDFTLPDDRAFFPLQGGRYWIYQVDETKISFNVSTTSEYQVKMIVTDSFLNVEGRYSYILSRFKRSNSNNPWSSLDTWQARINDKELVVNIDNVPYVKLSFPIVASKEWNGNNYNAKEPDEYQYNADGEFQSNEFGRAIEMIESDSIDKILGIDIRKFHFARSVGLIKIEWDVQVFCTLGPCEGIKFVDTGLIQEVTLIEHGKE